MVGKSKRVLKCTRVNTYFQTKAGRSRAASGRLTHGASHDSTAAWTHLHFGPHILSFHSASMNMPEVLDLRLETTVCYKELCFTEHTKFSILLETWQLKYGKGTIFFFVSSVINIKVSNSCIFPCCGLKYIVLKTATWVAALVAFFFFNNTFWSYFPLPQVLLDYPLAPPPPHTLTYTLKELQV